MPEIPEYVTYFNDGIERMTIRLENLVKDSMKEMATKAELQIIEERLNEERAARRRMIGFVGGLTALIVTSAVAIVAAEIAAHHL